MSDFQKEESEKSQLIKKKFISAEFDKDSKIDQEEVKVGFLLKIWYAIRGYAIDDIDRLYKAGVNHAEARANKPSFENKKLDAEASEKYMQAELTKQEAIKKKIENETKMLELEKEKLELKNKELKIYERRIEAFERFKKAINTIKVKDGEVLFDSKQIQKMLSEFGKGASKNEELNE